MQKLRRIIRNRRGIDTILAALLMVVIVVVASVMVYAWSTGLLGSLLVKPTTGQESLAIDNSSFSSTNSTNVLLYIRNLGSVSSTLSSYYVKDPSSGNQYSKTSWTGPSINPNSVAATPVNIDGVAFTFTTGKAYTITVVSSRNNQFVFQVTK